MGSSETELNFEGNLDFVFPVTDSDNGIIYFNQTCLPEEIIILILSYVPCIEVLKVGLVCKRWYNITRSNSMWILVYQRKYHNIPKSLPWYTFYALFTSECFDNMLKNCFGEDEFNNWIILENGGNEFAVENSPWGSHPFPPELQKATGCFVTSFGLGCKIQKVFLPKLIKHIVRKFKPHIYACEWVAGSFYCGGDYTLEIFVFDTSPNEGGDTSMTDSDVSEEYYVSMHLSENILKRKRKTLNYKADEAPIWEKVEVELDDYPVEAEGIIFLHSGVDNQFWRGHYGPKMTGGQLKLLFESMEPEREPLPEETSQSNIDDDVKKLKIN